MSRCSDLKQRLLAQDQFSEQFNLRVDDKQDKLPSKIGALCTYLMVLVLLAYTGYKVDVQLARKSTNIVQAVEEDKFDENSVFGADQGLNIAVGVFSLKNPLDFDGHLDPRYGHIEFKVFSWGQTPDEILGVTYDRVESHSCTPEELGLSGTDH